MADSIEDRFAVETELLGLELLPGQEANLRAAHARQTSMPPRRRLWHGLSQ